MAARVQVDVVDPAGNHWLQLQKATAQQPGPYQLEWSGRDAAGKIATPEGLYTIEVTATETAGRGERTVRRGGLRMRRPSAAPSPPRARPPGALLSAAPALHCNDHLAAPALPLSLKEEHDATP